MVFLRSPFFILASCAAVYPPPSFSRTASDRALLTPSTKQLALTRTRMVVRTPCFLQWEQASRESYLPSPRMMATGRGFTFEMRRSLATAWQQPQSYTYLVIASSVLVS